MSLWPAGGGRQRRELACAILRPITLALTSPALPPPAHWPIARNADCHGAGRTPDRSATTPATNSTAPSTTARARRAPCPAHQSTGTPEPADAGSTALNTHPPTSGLPP